jgi:hypothetical protein
MNHTEFLSLIVLGGGALGVIAKWVVMPLFRLGKAIEYIHHEMSNNSGRSVKDLAERTDGRLEFLFSHLGVPMPEHLRTPPPKEQ